jgi:hypothetical protein
LYIPQPILILLIIIYLLFLVSIDWINQTDGAWYRPFIVGLIVIAVAGWAHREQENDELE